MKESVAQYKAMFSSIREVWVSYGGWGSLLGSPLLHLSFFISAISFGAWIKKDWWDSGLSVIPAILGFAIGTFAIFVAIGDEKFRELIAKGGIARVNSVRQIYNSFVFLILLQSFAVITCLFAGSRPTISILEIVGVSVNDLNPMLAIILAVLSVSFRFFGFTLVVYSVLSVIPMTLSVLRMGSIYLGSFLIRPPGGGHSPPADGQSQDLAPDTTKSEGSEKTEDANRLSD